MSRKTPPYIHLYYFSIEGNTEKFYLEHLQGLINSTDENKATPRVKFQISYPKETPVQFVKRIPIVNKIEIWHLFDYEGYTDENKTVFRNNLDSMKEAEKIKSVKYHCGYCNLSFELWMILHKADCNGAMNKADNYLTKIKEAFHFQKNYNDLRYFKNEVNFKNLLKQIKLADISQAIKRAEKIKTEREKDGNPVKYKGFEYYEKNPSLKVHEIIKKILEDTGLYQDEDLCPQV